MALPFVTLTTPPFAQGEDRVGGALDLNWRRQFNSTETSPSAGSTRLRGYPAIDPLATLDEATSVRAFSPSNDLERTFPIHLDLACGVMTIPSKLERRYLKETTRKKMTFLAVEVEGNVPPEILGLDLGGGRYRRFDHDPAPERTWALGYRPVLETNHRPFEIYRLSMDDFGAVDFTRVTLEVADTDRPQSVNGWFNPVVWSTVAAWAPSEGSSLSDVERPPFFDALTASAWHVLPLIDLRRAPLARFLETWDHPADDVDDRCALDHLLWGPGLQPAPTWPPWLAFLALDSLNGCFLIERQGLDKPIRFAWRPAAEPLSETQMLIEHLVRCWGGELRDPGAPPPAAPNDLGPLSRSKAHVPDRVSDAALGDAAVLLRKHRATRDLESYLRLADLIDAGKETCPDWRRAHLGTILYRKDPEEADSHLVHFDHAEFLQRFVRRWLLPRSPVRVQVPHPGEPTAQQTCYDPFGSRTFGARRFFTDLCRSRSDSPERDPTLEDHELLWIDGKPGWWHRWARALHTDRTDRRMQLQSAFVLGDSRIGSRLGTWSPDATPRDEMRFY